MLPPYPLLLILHLGAVALFGSMTLLVAVSLASAAPNAASAQADEWRRLHLMNRVVGLPALALVWVLGIALAVKGGWLQAGWLHAKIACVVAVSALHGVQSARLRRLATGTAPAPRRGGWHAAAIAALLVVIVALVSAKPG